MNFYKKYIKRILDIVIATISLLVLSPIFIITTLLLALANHGKPFFYQLRPGKNEARFKIVKFKTMSDKKDLNGILLSDAERLTAIGKIVRKLSIDELPQLINILKGDMSLIGPRPLLISYLPLYNEIQRRRHEVKPGITGWAQVNGRNAISWERKFELDVWYVDHLSFLLDCKIIWLTFMKVIRSEGISSNTHATMEKFQGTPSQKNII
ncbi:sugar transferase [Leptobacterium sp. I13]|uniref:sugar transferase n=1 Tax=Leptobacterium meishanense TaxID=3128904 RepID=UPI0030ED9C17